MVEKAIGCDCLKYRLTYNDKEIDTIKTEEIL